MTSQITTNLVAQGKNVHTHVEHTTTECQAKRRGKKKCEDVITNMIPGASFAAILFFFSLFSLMPLMVISRLVN